MRAIYTLIAGVLLFVSCTTSSQSYDFELLIIDNNYNNGTKPGWSRMGDMDQDGRIDVVAGGGNYTAWYKNPDWKKSYIGTTGCNGGILYDVDGDSDLDVIASVKSEGNGIYWFENPNQRYPKSEDKENWKRRVIDDSADLTFQHDLEMGDIDMDGVPDDFVALFDNYRTKQATVKWYRKPANPKTESWGIQTIVKNSSGGVGLAIADINGDGYNDVVRGGKWYEAPNRETGKWIEHENTSMHLSNVRTADMDGDGDMDIVAASGWQDSGQLMWMENRDNGREFVIHNIAVLWHPENVVVMDIDFDGDYEIVTGEMKGEDDSSFLVFENDDVRNDQTWKKHVIDQSHGISARMNTMDFDGDGDMDIVCDGNAQSHIYVWVNKSTRKISSDVSFEFFNLDTTYAPGWIRQGDMDNDGDTDIIAGGGRQLHIYENDGNSRGWKRFGSLENPENPLIGCNAAVIYDVDGDNDLDIIASRYYKNLGWWENPGGKLTSEPWEYHVFHNSESYYLHDIIRVDMDKNGKKDEIIANVNKGYWKSDVKISWFRPGDTGEEMWKANVIEPGRRETHHGHAGLDFGDINGDGQSDLAYSNGWYERTGNRQWTWREVTEIYGISNTNIRDMDSDGDMDLVMSAGHHNRGVYWFEANKTKGDIKWTQHTIDEVVHNPEGLQVVDIDGDGDWDIVAAELFFGEGPGEADWADDAHNLYLYKNHGGNPIRWEKINIAKNKRPCHSCIVVDINGDGKPDVIAESSGAPGVIYIENTSKW
ncbi:FG-GAP repeat domain-containing protein [candidate division KSB1 bacterium]